MDQNQGFDPNRTVIGAPTGADPNRTQAMSGFPATRSGEATTAWTPQKAVSVRVMASRDATMANGPAREQFLVEIVAGDDSLPGAGVSGTRTPVNLCLVIDRSGSMEGSPIEHVKQACSFVVDLLSPNDVLSIVTFEDTVDVLMPPQRVTNKQQIKDGILRLQVGNTTNLYDGLALGLQQVLATPDPGRAKRLVVLTDGEPTSGITEFQSLVQHASNIKGQGVTCTFLGFGLDYNEELLASMAKRAGGNYYFIASAESLPEVFRTELSRLTTLGMTNLQLSMKLARWVRLRAATGQSVPPGEREFTLALADLERGSTLQQVFDLEFPNHPLGHYRVAAGKLTYDDAIAGRPESVDVDFVMEFTSDVARYSAPPNPQVAAAADVAAASRTVERTIMGLKTGQLSAGQAMAELQKTQALLLNDGRVSEAQEVTLALNALRSGDAGGAEKTLMGTMVKMDQGKKGS